MLLTALPPAPPTPSTVIRGLSSFDSGALRLIVMYYLHELTSRLPIHTPGDIRIVFVSSTNRSAIPHPRRLSLNQRIMPRRGDFSSSCGGLGSLVSGGL